MIVIPADLLAGRGHRERSIDLSFACWDNGDVYNGIDAQDLPQAVSGTLCLASPGEQLSVDAMGKPNDVVRVIAAFRDGPQDPSDSRSSLIAKHDVKGYVRANGAWKERPVECVPVREDLYSRLNGILETDILSDKGVYAVGIGSFGAHIAIELAKAGVSHFELMDHDRLEVVNVVRHAAGLSDVGRYKNKFASQAIRQKNPSADVRTWETKVSRKNRELLRQIVRRNDLVICTTDDRESRLILNKLCIEENKPIILAGAFRRAYGGQVLFVLPHQTPCYQCLVQSLPDQAADEEISSAEQARRVEYSDRPVPVEPGLSTDIAPLWLMVVKLAIQYLLKGKATTLRCLDEDLVAAWYLWLNRREAGTDYEKLEPLEFNVDGMHILRWYGIAFERRPDCPACGDFVGHSAAKEGIEITEADLAPFAGA